MIESGYKRYNLRANLSYDIRPWLTLGTNIGLTHTRSEGPRSLGGTSANGAHFSPDRRSSPSILSMSMTR